MEDRQNPFSERKLKLPRRLSSSKSSTIWIFMIFFRLECSKCKSKHLKTLKRAKNVTLSDEKHREKNPVMG
jgi:hypothetical protein